MSTNSNLKLTKKRNATLRQVILTGMFLAILVVQEQLLIFLPNIQLTVVLIMVYASFMPSHLLGFLIVGYVFLDNLIMGSFSIIYTPPMLIAWILLAVIGRLVRNSSMIVVLLSAFLFGFVYGWIYIPFSMIVHGIDIFWPYLLADLPFEITMALNNYLTVLILYKPLRALLEPLMIPKNENEETDAPPCF
ncbi:MAG: hypothetical protein ACOX16_02205 [Candidatus Izemoplasmatales bacterium]|jgi:energy-coupling factor transport system substrate-specific component